MVDGPEQTLPFDNFLFPKIFRAFRISIQPTKLIVAFAALALICLAGWLMDLARPSVAVTAQGVTELHEYMPGILRLDSEGSLGALQNPREQAGVFVTLWDFAAWRLHSAVRALFQLNIYGVIRDLAACFVALAWAFDGHTLYSILFFAIVLAALSVAGGAICRIAALQFAGAERPGLTDAVRFGIRKFAGFFAAPITPVAIIVVIGAFIMLLGLWGNIPYVGEISVGLLLPLAFAVAAVIAVIAIGLLAGLGLMFPTIAYEDSDSFDAISRSFSYVYAKPWRMALYLIIAFVYGAVCYLFVRFFLFFVLWITHIFLRFGFLQRNENLYAIWPEPDFLNFFGAATALPNSGTMRAAEFLIDLWVLAVAGLLLSFVISFYFSVSTIIYALMRNRVDRIALEEVYIYSPEGTTEPTSEELPVEEPSPEAKPQPPDESHTMAEGSE